MRRLRTGSVREALAWSRAAYHYPFFVVPNARRELRRWERRARRIPDPTLRAHALAKLADEALNPEAAAVFSLLAPVRRARQVVTLTVAFQVLYDYLDSVGEQDVPNPLENGRQLHQALVDAVDPRATRHPYYRLHPQDDDGGYIDALISTCHGQLAHMPALAAVRPVLSAAMRRCAEAQSRTNAAAPLGTQQLRRWTLDQLPDARYHWWEVAAGAAADLSVLALLATAADHRTTPTDAAAIDRAYQPAICALTTLLDSLIDYDLDNDAADHRYLAHYISTADMQRRLTDIATASMAGARELPNAASHTVLVAGIAALYLSAPEADRGLARPVAASVIQSLRPAVALPLGVMRVRRRWLTPHHSSATPERRNSTG